MNTVKKYITVAVLIFCTYFSYAQKMGFRTAEDKLKFQKHIMSSTTFIFEGTVISQKCYRQSPNGTILTCSTIEIKKIFKGSGQIKLGTIKVITVQGESIPEEHPNNEDYVVVTDSETGIEISKGNYIVFATLASSSMLGNSNSPAKTIKTDNALVVQVMDLIGQNRTFWYSVEVKFKTVDELYSFLKDKGGLKVQEQKEEVMPTNTYCPAVEPPGKSTSEPPKEKGTEVFSVVQEMPEFPGGAGEMMKFIQKNLHYPEIEKEAGITGKCFVKFIVEQDGSISNVVVLKGIAGGANCDKEAVRLIESMPKWSVGKQNGNPARVYFNVPISFRLK